MATCVGFVADQELETSTSAPQVQSVNSREDASQAELDYDFVEQPNQDLYCPVSLDILLEPHQTECCGQHISKKAADRIIRDGKPCPMCKDDNFTTHTDKYFKRNTINKLKVRCPHKKSGCDWVGELGDLNIHSASCPKRPWKCQHCDFESTYEVGSNDHTPNCTKYPLPCPNQCEIGTVPRCDLEKHLLVCPLQLVECEFVHSGCDIKVPRRDLTKHMTESAQQHLMSATLLNLRLTRELHQKMEEKDQQIVDLQEQVKDLDSKVERKFEQQTGDLDTKLQQQTGDLDTKLQQQTGDLDTKLQQHSDKTNAGFKQQAEESIKLSMKVETQIVNLDSKLSQQITAIQTEVLCLSGFSHREFTLTEFNMSQAKGGDGSWHSDGFYCYPGGYQFKLNIDTNGYKEARGTHLTAYLNLIRGSNDENLKWPIKCTVYLQLLNQLGDHGHIMSMGYVEYKEAGYKYERLGLTNKFFPLAQLGHCADQNTQYLKDDCMKFRLYLKVE